MQIPSWYSFSKISIMQPTLGSQQMPPRKSVCTSLGSGSSVRTLSTMDSISSFIVGINFLLNINIHNLVISFLSKHLNKYLLLVLKICL